MTFPIFALFLSSFAAQAAPQPPVPQHIPGTAQPAPASYMLGPGDQVTIRVLDVDEFTDKPIRVDSDGSVVIPLVGRIRVAGMTVKEFESILTERLRSQVWKPQVSVSVAEFGSQPVSVLGAVKNPGVYQLQGGKTLVEALSMAGGLDPAAASTVKVTRRLRSGAIPLKSATTDPSGEFSVAEVSLVAILKAQNPEENIVLCPNDVVSVPRAELVYVVGQVQRAGGFPLTDRKDMSVLQALSLAGGLDRTASATKAVLLRPASDSATRKEIPVDLKRILEGRAEDIAMRPEDILFVPNSTPKRAALRAVEAAVQMGTGIVIWRRP